MRLLIGIMLPLLGTMIGASFVFFIKNNLSNKTKSIILSLSSGIMLSSSIFSLLIPSINQSSNILIPILGFSLGIISLLLVNRFIPDNHLVKNKLMILSIIIHNIPEGMAVGVALASISSGYMTSVMALVLSLGIAIQNIPEGAIVSIPLYTYNNNKEKSFMIGILSGIVEPISAIIAYVITQKALFLLPIILSFAAGTMIYVIVEELMPSCNYKNNIIPFSIGFLLMIILEYLF